jgi:uncharacterized MAPEG superfamily protein
MTPELTYLTLTMLLAASLWIPYIAGVNMYLPKGINPFQVPPDKTLLPDWVRRADRAHLNLLEQALPFAVLVLLAHSLGVTTTVTVWATAAFFWLRLAHAIGMITGITQFPLRPVIFTAGWLCVMAIGVALLTA